MEGLLNPIFKNKLREIIQPYQGGRRATLLSLGVDLFIIIGIMASCTLVPLGYLYPHLEDQLRPFEIIFTILFIIEYLLRWYAAEDRLSFPLDRYALIDLIAVLPSTVMLVAEFFVLQFFRGAQIFLLLRLLRLIRILKFIRYRFLVYRSIIFAAIWLSAVKDRYRLGHIARLFFLTGAAWILGANLLHLTETRLVGEQGPYADYWRAYWNTMIVLISGIEDKEPLSLLGRLEVTVLLLCGICIIGVVAAEIVSIISKTMQRAGKIPLKPPHSHLEQHIIIFGQNVHLDNIIRQLNAAVKGWHYILIVCQKAEDLVITSPSAYRSVLCLSGDPLQAETLKKACLDDAVRVMILSDDRNGEDTLVRDNRTLMETLAVSGHRDVPMIVELNQEASLRYASTLDQVEFFVSRSFGAKLAAQAVINPGVTLVYDSLITFTDNSNEIYTIPIPPNLIGKTFNEGRLFFLEYKEEDITLAGIERHTNFLLNPLGDQILLQNDKLIVLAYGLPTISRVSEEDLWSGRILPRT